jgi:hypothetical protein
VIEFFRIGERMHMKAYADQIEGLGIGVILEQEWEDVMSEIDGEFNRDSGDIDVSDPRLISGSIEINPEADAYEPLTTVAII